jgi:hypothetical protein
MVNENNRTWFVHRFNFTYTLLLLQRLPPFKGSNGLPHIGCEGFMFSSEAENFLQSLKNNRISDLEKVRNLVGIKDGSTEGDFVGVDFWLFSGC